MDPKIFITYSSKDQQVARTICTALENRGLACWISSRNVKAGQNFQEQIVKAIRAARRARTLIYEPTPPARSSFEPTAGLTGLKTIQARFQSPEYGVSEP